MVDINNRKMFANNANFQNILDSVTEMYKGIETVPKSRGIIDLAASSLDGQTFTGRARDKELPSGASILVNDLTKMFGDIARGKREDELLSTVAEGKTQKDIMDTAFDIYKESLDTSDDNLTEFENARKTINSYDKRIQAGETLSDWELKDYEILSNFVDQAGTGKYEAKDWVDFRADKREKMDVAKDTQVILDEAKNVLSGPDAVTNPAAASLNGFVKLGDAFNIDIDGILDLVGLDRLTMSGADADTLSKINQRIALDLAQVLTGNKSNFELQTLLTSGVDLAGNVDANMKMLNILDFYAKRSIAYGKFANESNNLNEYNKKVDEWDSNNPGPFDASKEMDKIKAADDSFMGFGLDNDEGSYVIEGQGN